MKSGTMGNGKGSGKLFTHLQLHLASCDCTLIADLGRCSILLVQMCQAQHWYYLLHIGKAHTYQCWLCGRWTDWVSYYVVGHRSGQHWFGRVRVFREQTLETYLSSVWDEG